MDTRTTLADARAALYDLINVDDPNDPKFLRIFNEVRERLINSGKWKGCVVSTVFDSSAGFITLPYDYLAVLGTTYDRYPAPVFTQFHEYVEQGPGEFDETLKFPGQLIDMGDGFATQANIETAGVIRVYSSAADNADVVRLFGEDENGDTIYDSSGNEGVNVTLAAPYVATTAQFSKVTAAQKPLTSNRVYLKVWDGATETQIAEYQPNETRPMYRRYKTGEAEEAIRVICQLRYMPVSAETDWVKPGNISALRAGIRSWLFEDQSDMASADESMVRAYNFLNDEAKATRGGARVTVDMVGGTFGRTYIPFMR